MSVLLTCLFRPAVRPHWFQSGSVGGGRGLCVVGIAEVVAAAAEAIAAFLRGGRLLCYQDTAVGLTLVQVSPTA